VITLYHAGNDPERTARLLARQFDASDEEQLNFDSLPAVWCSSEVYPWAAVHDDGAPVIIDHVLAIELNANEAELEAFVDRERGMPSGSFWLPCAILNERTRSVTEVDPETFADERFWTQWSDWYARRQAILDLDEP
jgi:hypothetical protein